MQITKLILCAAISTPLAWAQSSDSSPQPPDQKGAKALFFDTETGNQTPSTAKSPMHPRNHPATANRQGQPTVPEVTGLKYYFELREPNGELLKVKATHIFHSGDRMRMHVSSNIDGDLVIYQQQDDTPEERLFPSPKLPEAAGHVTKGADTALPSAKSWFLFDQHPGQIHITVMLSAQGSHPPQQPAAPSPSVLLAENDAGAAHSLSGMVKGSKALQIEADDSPQDVSEYKVVDSRLDSRLPPGVIAVEVTLNHTN